MLGFGRLCLEWRLNCALIGDYTLVELKVRLLEVEVSL